jgi:hypothetical protein
MKTKIMLTGLGLVAVLGGVLLIGGGAGASRAGERAGEDREVSKNPALLVSPNVRVGELTVYGVKLGASTDTLGNEAGVTAVGIPERPQDMIYVGRNVRYYANDRKIYRITVIGELAKQLPTYDAARLQMAMGRADEVVERPTAEDTCLSFFARHVRYTVHAFRTLTLVTEVDLYAP